VDPFTGSGVGEGYIFGVQLQQRRLDGGLNEKP